ncbi:HesA/MoeB/ThiF family protein [Vibrio ziniensis]|uniref:HesA/MoeB/ThiF family protein n=1 Tax=Vibrio ziniensis TaxID=2711221 RepID=A0A6G7CLV1_9VIBR|nr:HesA/MoeB/ThiF family protein [Vibrio ziniensis]QIH43111.1 HesA/MoeB/ThiF family protein [Vibrio ziniensis]
MLSDNAFIRYQRQICLPEVGEEGQKRLCDSSVLIIGCGGLGNAAALYLAGAGIGKLVICDDDDVDISNLSRQIAFRTEHISTSKVDSLSKQLKSLNPDCHIRTVARRVDSSVLPLEVEMADLVLDCSDNLETRHLINRVCFESKVPLISGAAIGWDGQVIVFDFTQASTSVCYACLVPIDSHNKLSKCSELGVIGPVVGVIGNLQALLAIQYLIGLKELKTHRLHKFDGKSMIWQTWNLVRDPDCPVCGEQPEEKGCAYSNSEVESC